LIGQVGDNDLGGYATVITDLLCESLKPVAAPGDNDKVHPLRGKRFRKEGTDPG
jgi:hypothetical protein